MLRMIAIIFGIAFIFVGVAGFLPTFYVNGLLFGFFMVDSLHNIVHIATGVLGIMAATRASYARLFFQVLGVVYTVLALLGFLRGDLFIMQVNLSDNVFHVVVGIISLYLGFAARFKRP